MSRVTVDKARGIHKRHPGLTFPLDMERLAYAEGCECLSWPFIEPVREMKQGRWIGIAQGLEESERRHLIAHALAHHLLHRGNQLSFHGWQKACLSKQEREAEECAAHILMPEAELEKVIDMPTWELAEHFGVPEQLVRQRVTEFATGEEMSRWQSAGYDQSVGQDGYRGEL